VKQLLESYRGAPPIRSEFERDFLSLIERAGLPKPLVNARLDGLEVDFYWPQHRLVVELDSRGYHASPRTFETDRLRDARLMRAGIRVLRITYRRFYDFPLSVLDDLIAVIALVA
jgi:very-short-patch-repair endonuclease